MVGSGKFKGPCALEYNVKPSKDFTPLKNVYKKERRRKPKRKDDCKAGRIRKWNEFFNGRGKCMSFERKFNDQVEASFRNKKSEWKVYSRCPKGKNEKEIVKGKVGKEWVENSYYEDWQELED